MRSQVKAEVLAEFIYDGTKITTAAAVATATTHLAHRGHVAGHAYGML